MSGGFTFGTPTGATGAAAGTGLFGQSAQPAAAGVKFGAMPTATTTATAAPSAGFNFGATPASGSGFGGGGLGATPGAGMTSLGGTGLAGTPQQTATGGFSFAATGGSLTGQSTTGFGVGTSSTPGFSFAATKPASTAAPTGLNLGGTATTAAAPPAGGFSFSTPAAAKPPAQPTGFNLAGTAPSAAAAMTTSGATTGMLSNLLAAPTPTAPASTGAPTTGFSLTGLSQPSTTAAAAASTGFKLGATTTTATPATGLTLGGGGLKLGPPATATPATTATGLGGLLAPASTAAAAPGAGFGFNLTSTAKTTASGGLVLGATSTAASTTATATSTAVPSQQMNYKQLEDKINKWMSELEDQERLFLTQATQVNAWDRLLIDNGEKITQLNNDMERVNVDQSKLEQELEFIKSQQRELEELLVPMETSLEQVPSSSLQPHADLERENTYQLADNIDAQLKRMVQDLKEIIDHLNTSTSTQDNTDPILQITKILNAHMDSLQWIDTNTVMLSRRVEDISRQMESQRKDQERNFRLVYD